MSPVKIYRRNSVFHFTDVTPSAHTQAGWSADQMHLFLLYDNLLYVIISYGGW